ncbi:MAG: hypothetical protein ACYTG5_13815 [Planctomycetota bacterium]|jgi:hypothetical protein
MHGRTILRHGLLPILVYLLGFIVLTWPSIGYFSSHFITDTGDGLQNVWNIWWVNKAVTELGMLPWYTDYLHHAEGVTLIGQTLNPINGLMGIPLSWVFGPEQVFNFILVFSFVSTGLTCYWLALYFKSCSWTALFAGFAFTFSSFHFAHAYGHLQLVTLEGLPLFLLLWLRFLDSPGHLRGLAASAALLLLMLSDLYYTFYAVMAGAFFFAYRSARRRDPWRYFKRKNLLPLLSFACLSAAFLLPMLLNLVMASRADPFEGAHNPDVFGMDLQAPFVPGAHWAWAHFSESIWSKWSGNAVESSAYLRWTLIIPALYAILRSRAMGLRDEFAWVILGLLFGLLSLGPLLHMGGEAYPDLPMPYSALVWLVPPLEVSGMPARMMVMLMLSVCLLAPAALPLMARHIPKMLRLPALALYLLIFLVETWPYELPRNNLPEAEYNAMLRDLPEGGVAGLDGEPISLLQQTRHEKPMSRGYVSRLPESLSKRARELDRLREEKRFRELLERSGCRYLLLGKFEARAEELAGLKKIRLGSRQDLFALEGDSLPAVDVPARDCASGASIEVKLQVDPESGLPKALEIRAPADAGRKYLMAFSLGEGPGLSLADGRVIPLEADALYAASTNRLGDHAAFPGQRGVLDASGRAVVHIELGEISEFRGMRIHYCVAVYDSSTSSNICRLGGSGSFVY